MDELDTRQKILKVAREILNEKDYYETVVDEIAEKSGVSKGTVFFYFKSKENLFKEILSSVIEDMYNMISDVGKMDMSGLEKLKTLYDRYIDFGIKNMYLMTTIRREIIKNGPEEEESIKNIVLKKFSTSANELNKSIQQMYNERTLKKFNLHPNPEEIIAYMFLIFGGAVGHMLWTTKDRKDFEIIKQLFWEILLHGILNEEVSIEMAWNK